MPQSRPFELVAPYLPTGDQPTAIAQITENLQAGLQEQVLLGATGSGKTFTIANVIQNVQKPTLVLAHNKTLAAQLFAELREFFPNNSVQYFVSYYDYYQPEAYVPRSDTYIDKEADINQEIEKFRHASTHALLTRKDVIIVASVSCIYGLGSPEVYKQANYLIKTGDKIPRSQLTRRLSDMQYERNDLEIKRGRFSVKGDVLTIFPAYDDFIIRLTQFGDQIEQIDLLQPVSGQKLETLPEIEIYPAKHYLTDPSARTEIIKDIRHDFELELSELKAAGKLVEAQRLGERISYDLEMMEALGTVNGIENYSRYFDKRAPGTPPSVLLDYFPSDYLLVIDESHITLPQIGGMYNGDKARKTTLVDYGFRLRAALDNRPLQYEEFRERMGQTIYASATPSPREIDYAKTAAQALRIQKNIKLNPVSEQLIRPTGILDPVVEVRPLDGQIDDVIKEVKIRVERGQRALVTTLTKRMSEDITEFLLTKGVKVQYLHSDIETIERSNILQELRKGSVDVVVGINLLREGLDLPEVSLICILDADKEGFLRSATALVQTIGRAARHPDGRVIMYADKQTGSMTQAIQETARRRQTQAEYNQKHGIVPQIMQKPIRTNLPTESQQEAVSRKDGFKRRSAVERANILDDLREQMRQAALNLEFERATELRDEIQELTGQN